MYIQIHVHCLLWELCNHHHPICIIVEPQNCLGPSWPRSHSSWIYNLLCSQFLSPLMLWVRMSIKARCTTLCDTVCQWFAIGQWFSPGPPVSSTIKTDRHDIPEILLKVALGTIKQTNKQTNKQLEQLVAKKNYICLLIAFLMCAIL